MRIDKHQELRPRIYWVIKKGKNIYIKERLKKQHDQNYYTLIFVIITIVIIIVILLKLWSFKNTRAHIHTTHTHKNFGCSFTFP